MRTLRLLVAGALAVLSFSVVAPSPAHAAAEYENAHWSKYQWYGKTVSDQRYFWLFDRTGNATMHQAIQQWVQSWNNQRNAIMPSAPAVYYSQDDANVGKCGNYNWYGYSYMTFCQGDPGTTGVANLMWSSSGGGNHMLNPFVVVRPAGLNYGQLFTATAHEMGHVLGLGHRPEKGVLMNAASNFDGNIHWYDQTDLNNLAALYGNHSE